MNISNHSFYGLSFLVNPDVLIPYSITEELVEKAIGLVRNKHHPIICDVGTGCGNIIVSILRHLKHAKGIGLDISHYALDIAEQNAIAHKVMDRLLLQYSDVFSGLDDEKFDLIVANTPYLPKELADNLSPYGAVTDGKDGLTVLKTVIREARDFLKPNGYLALEYTIPSKIDQVLGFFDTDWKRVEASPYHIIAQK